MSVLTGAGVDRVFSGVKRNSTVYRFARGIFLIASLISAASALGIFLLGNRTLAMGLVSWALGAAFLLGLLLWRPTIQKTLPSTHMLLLVLLCLDIVLFARTIVSSNPYPSLLSPARTVLEYFIPRTEEPSRVMFLKQARPVLNEGMALDLQTTDGYDPLIVRRYVEFITRAVASDAHPDIHRIHLENYASRLVDFLNIRYILSPVNLHDPKLILRHRNALRLYENTAALPRAFVVDRIVVKKKEEALPYMGSPQFDPRREAVVEENILSPPVHHPSARPARVHFLSYRPNTISIQVEAPTKGLLVLSDVYYPGWHVTVDGKEEKILEVNYCFRGVPLTPGSHTIKFSFKPRSFRIGLGISLASLLLCLGGLIVSKRDGYLFPFRRNRYDL